MAEIKLNKEQVEQLQKCKTKEEVAKFAKENQLTDEELEKVVGGGIVFASLENDYNDPHKPNPQLPPGSISHIRN